MQLTLKLGNIRVWVSARRVEQHLGACSRLDGDMHILMWDFDDVPLARVCRALTAQQVEYELPAVYVLETRPGTSYIAYCMARAPWDRAVAIVATTKYVDWNFVRLSVIRGYFTLRVSPKRGVEPKLAVVLESPWPAEASVDGLGLAVRYETSRKPAPSMEVRGGTA